MAQFVPSARKYFLQPPKMGPQNWTPKLGPKIGPRRLIAGLEPTAKRRGKWWRVDQLFRLPKGHRRAEILVKTTGEMVANWLTFPVPERSSPGSNPRQDDGVNGDELIAFFGRRITHRISRGSLSGLTPRAAKPRTFGACKHIDAARNSIVSSPHAVWT